MLQTTSQWRGTPLPEASLLRTRTEVDALVPEWTALFHESGVPNPFAHPVWLITWFDHYARNAEPYFVTVREEGRLLAVAPFYLRRHVVMRGLPAITRAHLLGVTTQVRHITEMPQILTAAGASRKSLRTIVAFLAERSEDWDWLELTVTPEQGIFVPDWVKDFDGYVLYSGTRVAMILPLPASWDDLRAGLKPSAKEGIRRAFKGLSREGRRWELLAEAGSPAELQDQLSQLIALKLGSAMERAWAVSGSNANLRFLEDVGSRLFSSGLLVPCFLRVDGLAVAGQLILRANNSIFFAFSGFDPKWLSYGVATTLKAEILRASIEHGDRLANLAFHPHTAKLRWSEQLAFHNDYILVGTRRFSRIAFSLWWQRRALWALRREAIEARFRVKYAATKHDGRRLAGVMGNSAQPGQRE